MAKLVYAFTEGDGKNKRLLGGKGANLCEMTQIGINVPPGFVITTEACLEFLDAGALPASLMAEVDAEIGEIINGTQPGRQDDAQITFFKSVGLAVQDAVTAAAVLKASEAKELGTVIDMS